MRTSCCRVERVEPDVWEQLRHQLRVLSSTHLPSDSTFPPQGTSPGSKGSLQAEWGYRLLFRVGSAQFPREAEVRRGPRAQGPVS